MFKKAMILSLLTTASSFAPSTVVKMTTRTMAMVAKEGDMAPMVTFKCRIRDEKIGGDNPFTWKDVTSADLFKGKRAVIFSLPGGIIY
jgi:hypothetical protein